MMQGDLNKSPMAPTHSSHMHTHSHSHTFSHTIYPREKYINICITKQYKGLSVVKYVFCKIKVMNVGHVISLVHLCVKTTSALAFNKISVFVYEKYSQFSGIWGTRLYVGTQKAPPPPH